MDTRRDLSSVNVTANLYRKQRVKIYYKTLEYMPAVTLKVRMVKGTNNGRYSLISPREEVIIPA